MGEPLRSIAEEAAACRAAFAAAPDATYAWHVHHERLAEPLHEPPKQRIAYILADKPEGEQALRLRLFRPVSDDEAVATAWRAYEEAVDAARRVRDEAMDAAGRAYDEAVDTAERAYDQALAPARRAYDEALAPAERAYDEALAPARRVRNEAAATAHSMECPDCPWDGQTIFPEAGQ